MMAYSKRWEEQLKLLDISTMTPNTPNGLHSVSEGKIFYGRHRKYPDGVNTVQCIKHGACLCVDILKNGNKLWRCLACHEGAISHNLTNGVENHD